MALRWNNTVPDEKKADQAASAPPPPTTEKPNEELEKLNSEIASLTEKNSELMVSDCQSQITCGINFGVYS